MKRFALVVAVAVLATAGLARAEEDGAALYASKCAACHGKDAKTGKIAKEPIAGKDEATVVKMIKEGGGKMKPVASLNEEQAKAVAKYVAGLK